MIKVDFTRTSMISGIKRTKLLLVDPDQLLKYERGELLIQVAFPHLSSADREFIITGITNEEWETAFKK